MIDNKSIILMTDKAESGNPSAQYNLAFCYEHGIGVEKDLAQALKWYKLFIKQKCPPKEIKPKRTKDGSHYTTVPVSTIVETGWKYYRQHDSYTAFNAFSRAAEMGNAEAQYMLGHLYLNGKGTEKSIKKAIRWYKIALVNGNMDACFELGKFYLYGTHLPRNLNKAFLLLTAAANKQHLDAQAELGKCHLYGWGTRTNPETAMLIFANLAKRGNTTGQYEYGKALLYGEHIAKNIDEGYLWLNLAAKKHHEDAEYEVGKCYHYGWGVKRDIKKACSIFEKLSSDNPEVQCELAICFMDSLTDMDFMFNVPKYSEYESKAFKMFLSAAKQGTVEAQYQVGYCYRKGIGTVPNAGLAKKWFETAAENGHEKAKEYLEREQNKQSQKQSLLAKIFS